MPQIEIVVSPQGQSQIETKGFTGAACRVASEFLEEALGQVAYEQLTAAFHQTNSVSAATATQNL